MSRKKVCPCTSSMQNTGTNNCSELMSVTRLIVYVSFFQKDGTRNSIDLTETLDKAYFDAFINNTDPFQRWFPTPILFDVKDERAEEIMQTFSDDRKFFIRDGIRSFEGVIWGKRGNPLTKASLDSARCSDQGVYLIDRTGGIQGGELSSDGEEMYPMPIDSQGIYNRLIQAQDKQIVGLRTGFGFDPDFDDADINYLPSSEFEADVNLLKIEGLKNVYAIFSDISTAGLTALLYLKGLNPLTKIPVTGLVTADFISVNGGAASNAYRTNNTPADVPLTSATESGVTPGSYAILFGSAATSADKIKLLATEDGYDFTAISEEVTIP